MQAASGPGGRAVARLRRLSVTAVRWLRSDIVDVVAVRAVNPAQPGVRAPEHGVHSGSHLEEALARWSRRFARERLFVLAPRGLAFALTLCALIALVLVGDGSRLTLAVALWLLVPPLVGLGAVLAGSWRDPRAPEVARVLDRDLALDERIGTAVEISGTGLAVDGLAALVLVEADAALVTSHLNGARPAHRSVRHEWQVIAAAALIISGLLLLISARGESSGLGRLAAVPSVGHRAGPTSVGSARGPSHPRRISGGTRNIGPGAGHAATPSLKSASRNSPLSVVAQPAASSAGSRLPPGRDGDERSSQGAFSRSGSQKGGSDANASTRGATGGASSRPGRSSSAAGSTHPARSSSRGGRPGSSRGAGGRSRAVKPQRVHAGSRTVRFNSNPNSKSRGSAKAPGSNPTPGTGHVRVSVGRSKVHAGRSSSSGGHSFGSGAGTGSGDKAVGRPQTKGLPGGFAGRLPIQAGYAPAHSRSGPRTSNPAGRPGGRGPARSATENGRGLAAAETFPYIPPSADIGPVDNALLQQYFRPAPTVRW